MAGDERSEDPVQESGENLTEEVGEEEEDRPADVDWEETEASPHQGEEGQQPV